MKKKMSFQLRQMIRKAIGFVLYSMLLLLADACLPAVWLTMAVKLVLVTMALYCLYGVLSYKRPNGKSKDSF